MFDLTRQRQQRISDKRVSRHHGLLDNLSGELRLKATHLNPCFIQSTRTDDPRPLQKGSWHVLRHGDFFSLLPGRFIYEVVSVGGDERTSRNSQMLEEEETLPVPPDPAVDLRPAARLNQEEPPSAAPEEDEEAERPFKGDSAGSVKDDQRGAAPSVTRRRVLPAWMLAPVPAAKTPPSTPTVRTCRPAAPSPATKRAAVAQATPTTTSSPEEAEFTRKEEERPRKRRKLSDDEEQPEVRPVEQTRHVATKTPADDEDEYEDSFINDDSEDAGDDSDYVPPDSDDSGKEDIKGLQRDATAFLKRRK
ncbi:aprataxin and PNK-like factor [Neolamprologus brichardi]|uniref:aprataxin and PNK-like factor n=1 Tax=Neolamprologus brichardi TaxID=32507 RepID=UPI0003EBE616|nr:aprataxin and PNK-like factor [Neolamprologus brichardi]